MKKNIHVYSGLAREGSDSHSGVVLASDMERKRAGPAGIMKSAPCAFRPDLDALKSEREL